MDYPGRVIQQGEADAAIVKALKAQLNQALVLKGDEALKLDPANPRFGPTMKQAVQLFQARHVDRDGKPLRVDGQVGSLTWEALFGQASVPQAPTASDPFLAEVLKWAGGEADKAVREKPPNSNRGPEVDAYLKRAGVSPGLAWCCAFTYWCFDEAAKAASRANPMFKTAGCQAHWNGAPSQGARRILRHQAVADPGLVQPGMLFIMAFTGGTGHTGFIERVEGGLLHTIEGNTDASKTREGGGVYRLTRKVGDINKGFIDYSGL
ncbi:CHAP domain-containing protein [Aquabacterium sp.]|uniref:CHAP domain-containing protein n=1 Tax=Aquabacterium sp. TaxID=1872578 RepID=UPI0025BD2979|nr:CHAP domain-containing protein [Aquabacterium sp.]